MDTDTSLLNPFVDVVKARRDYRDFKWGRIENLLTKAKAEQAITEMVKKVEFHNAFYTPDGIIELTDNELHGLSEKQRAVYKEQIHRAGSEGKGYFLGKKTLCKDNLCSELPMANMLYTWLNSTSCLELIADITGQRGLLTAVCEFTRFSQGQFLVSRSYQRLSSSGKIGFMIDFTPHWEKNWGGLLHLHSVYEGAGVTLTPEFNSMLLFDSGFDFSITYLANFIKYNRFSIMGCFCTDA